MSTALIDIVWNVTAICPWDCAVCCVSALHVRQRDGKVRISGPDLETDVTLDRDPQFSSIFDQALSYRQSRGLELSLAEKIKVLENFGDVPVKLDVAGGDALAPGENLTFLKVAAEMLGRQSITLSATGAGLARSAVEVVSNYISELNFTFDGTSTAAVGLRPATYSSTNLRKAKQYSDAGVSVRAECPLNVENISPEQLTELYLQLHHAGVDKLLVMRLFPVGRGRHLQDAAPSPRQYREAVEVLRTLESKYGTPSVSLQCALKHIEGSTTTNPCDAVTNSLGMSWNGTLLVSPWATDQGGAPLSDDWVLGDLRNSSLASLLASEKATSIRDRADDNYGHCKIFTYLHGVSTVREERLYELSDPLYA